jgi:hypothetical protein
MKLGKLGLYFILSASAVLYALADPALYKYKVEDVKDDDKKVKLIIGDQTTELVCKDKAQCDELKKNLTERKAFKITLGGDVPAMAKTEVQFADKKVLKFVVSGKDLSLEPLADANPCTGDQKTLEEKDIKLEADKIEFGDIKVPGASADLVKELKVPNVQHVVENADDGDLWAKGSKDGLDFSVVRKGKVVYVFTTKSASPSTSGASWTTYIVQGCIFLVSFAGIAVGMHFLMRSVDDDAVTAGVSGSSVMPQSLKDMALAESDDIGIEDDDDINVQTDGPLVAGGRRPGRTDEDVVIQGNKPAGTAEVTLAAMFLLPFVL